MKNKIGGGIFFVGIIIIITGQFLGFQVGSRIHEVGIQRFLDGDMNLFRSYYLSYPLGIIIAVIGALYSRIESSRFVLFLIIGLVSLTVYEQAHLIAGKYPNPIFFGIGGGLITLILLSFIWCWAKNRVQLGENAKTAADLQMLGYVFFAFASWTVCGIGGIPCYALYPDKMLKFQTLPLLFGLLAKVMIFFVLGWFFILLGQLKIIRSNKESLK
jgi:hypothetical protein